MVSYDQYWNNDIDICLAIKYNNNVITVDFVNFLNRKSKYMLILMNWFDNNLQRQFEKMVYKFIADIPNHNPNNPPKEHI